MDDHLGKYCVNISKHVFAITADGVEVMKKCGKLSDAEYQGCYSRALHLAVCEPNEEDRSNDDGNDGEIEVGVLILEEGDVEITIDFKKGYQNSYWACPKGKCNEVLQLNIKASVLKRTETYTGCLNTL